MNTSEAHRRLYHYTDSTGLLGILRTDTLWATRYDYLNDPSEIIFAKGELISRILPGVYHGHERLIERWAHFEQEVDREGGLDLVVQHRAEALVDLHYKRTGKEIYIVSFCGSHGDDPYVDRNGLLSQWRGYGNGGGFAIVFDYDKLKEVLKIEWKRFAYDQMLLSDVVYSNDRDKFEQELSEDLSTVANNIAHFYDVVASGRAEQERETVFFTSYVSFFKCITRLKHRGFCEENETRLAALRTVRGQDDIEKQPEKKVKVRSRNGQLVPYIELFDSADMKLPIEGIIVGPHRDKEARVSALRQMLSNTRIEITCSDIPYI